MIKNPDFNEIDNSDLPPVAILLLNYNNYEDTSNCVQELKQIDYAPLDIFVVDNGSSDGSRERLETEYSDITHIHNERNYGFPGGVNRGIKKILSTDVEYILLLNNDVKVVDPHFLRSMINIGEKYPKSGLIGSKIVDEKQNMIVDCGREIKIFDLSFRNPRRGIPQSEMTGEYYVQGISGACMLIKREVIEEVGLLDEKNYFFGGEDVDYCIRVRNSGWDIIVQADNPIIHHHSSTAGQNSKFITYQFTRNKVRRGITHFGLYGYVAILIRFIMDLSVQNPAISGDYEHIVPMFLGYIDAFTNKSEDDRNYLDA